MDEAKSKFPNYTSSEKLELLCGTSFNSKDEPTDVLNDFCRALASIHSSNVEASVYCDRDCQCIIFDTLILFILK